MLFKSVVFSSASGSINGITYSHNASGMYIRNRTMPVNPNTANQQAVRSAMAQLTSNWSNVLTAGQRLRWNNYAANVPLINKVGDPINVTGLNMYVRSNIPRLRAGLTSIASGPTNFTLADLAPISIVASEAGADLDLTFDDTQTWVDLGAASMIVQIGIQQSPTVEFFAGPFNFLDTIDGNATTAPTSPATIAVPGALTETNRLFVRARLSQADGRLSTPQIVSTIIAA